MPNSSTWRVIPLLASSALTAHSQHPTPSLCAELWFCSWEYSAMDLHRAQGLIPLACDGSRDSHVTQFIQWDVSRYLLGGASGKVAAFLIKRNRFDYHGPVCLSATTFLFPASSCLEHECDTTNAVPFGTGQEEKGTDISLASTSGKCLPPTSCYVGKINIHQV